MLILARYWQCQLCSQHYAQAHGTRNPGAHLTSVHGIREDSTSHNKCLKQSQKTIKSMMESASQIAPQQQVQNQDNAVKRRVEAQVQCPPLSVASIEDLIVRLLVKRDLPCIFATSQELHDLLYAIWPEAALRLPSSSNIVKAWIFRCFKTQKLLLKELLRKSLSQIHFTLDLWSSPNHLALLGVIAHFTPSAGTLTQALLALQEMEGAHTGENICHTFMGIVEDYDIRDRIGYFVMDNATNNDTFMDSLVEKRAESGLFLDTQEHRLR